MIKQLSVIIPVFNEAGRINQAIQHLFELDFSEKIQIVVVDGEHSGETVQAINHAAVKKIISRKGRGIQMNQGAAVADGNILLFLHADTVLPDRAFEQIVSTCKPHNIVGGAFDLEIQSDRPGFRVIEKVASLRSRMTRIPYGDQAIFIKSRFFNEFGGFKEIPIMEDVEFMRRIKRAGKRITFISDKVQTSPRRWEREGVIYCTLRNWILIVLYLFGVSPLNLVKFYGTVTRKKCAVTPVDNPNAIREKLGSK
ncbi:TIGR04283 family arsenosugar biosynthesis glycosyltransferase [Thermodesulfobacteriota bacterium]